MHNIHYIIAKVNDEEEVDKAIYEVVETILKNGNEDNCFSIIGIVNKKEEISIVDNSRWDESCLKFETIKKNIKPTFKYKEPTLNEIRRTIKGTIDPFIGSQIKDYFDFLHEKSWARTNNIWDSSFYPYRFNKVGITNMNDSEGNIIVAIDVYN